MRNIERAIGSAVAGAISIIAVLLLARPLLNAFSEIAKEVSVPVTLIVGLLLFAIGVGIFQRMTKR